MISDLTPAVFRESRAGPYGKFLAVPENFFKRLLEKTFQVLVSYWSYFLKKHSYQESSLRKCKPCSMFLLPFTLAFLHIFLGVYVSLQWFLKNCLLFLYDVGKQSAGSLHCSVLQTWHLTLILSFSVLSWGIIWKIKEACFRADSRAKKCCIYKLLNTPENCQSFFF